MDGQLTYQLQAWDQSSTFHFTFKPQSAIAEVMLAARVDHAQERIVPEALPVFTEARTAEGARDFVAEEGFTHAFAANGLSEVKGFLDARNCYAGAVLNIFFWSSVLDARENG